MKRLVGRAGYVDSPFMMTTAELGMAAVREPGLDQLRMLMLCAS
jgi:hypothetical protein